MIAEQTVYPLGSVTPWARPMQHYGVFWIVRRNAPPPHPVDGLACPQESRFYSIVDYGKYIASMPISADVIEEIRLRVACGFDNRETLYFYLFEMMADEMGIPEDVSHIDQLDADMSTEIRAAIEQMFVEWEIEMQSWPATTDCDRLEAALGALEQRGIVALVNCGATMDDGIQHAAMVSLVRDEIGEVRNDGYCCCHDQDIVHAVGGDGLWLTFGTFREGDPEEHAVEVGKSVVEACRKADLSFAWDGSTSTRIHLPQFRWQRRTASLNESDIADFLESWELELRAGYTEQGPAALADRAYEWFANFPGYGPQVLVRLQARTEQFLQEEHRKETGWAHATVNDRITAAFDELRRDGILALECLGTTNHDGWGYVGLEAAGNERGVVFFHHEDVIDGIEGQGLLLAFGALGVDPSSSDDAAIAQEIVAVLRAHGIECTWEGAAHERIRIHSFEWQRRRWTEAPAHERHLVSEPKSPGLLKRFLSRKGATRSGSAPAVEGAIVVEAKFDESGFDLRRSRDLRQRWKDLGHSGLAHAGHLGLPHVFVRAREMTTMLPVAAIGNASVQERVPILERALRSKQAP